jgi:hypothetical protein
MFRRAVYALACALALSLPALAQEQTGSITGMVKDTSGAVLPGVSVEALSLATGAIASTVVTDGAGVYRLIGLRPGKYEITAKLQGFTTAKSAPVDLRLGQILTVELALAVGGVAETVSVTAESPLIDTKQNMRQTNIRDEQVALLPHGRDFTSLVTQAPGANSEQKLGGLSIDGASAGENRYIIDGIETTDLQDGTSGKNLNVDLVDEVQVKSSGYTAEYGGAMGGVISTVTKSGTNDFHGTAGLQWQGDATSGGLALAPGSVISGSGPTVYSTGVPNLRASLTDDSVSEYVIYPEDDYNRYEPSISLGGPIAKDKVWFFGAYNPALIKYTRTVTPESAQNPAAASSSTTRKDQIQFISANTTAQIGNNLRTRVAYNNSWEKRQGLLANPNGLDPAGTNYSKTSEFPNWTLSGNADWVPSQKFVVSARTGYYMTDWQDTNVTNEPLYRWNTTNNIGFLDVPASLQHGTGFTSIPTNTGTDEDQFTRAFLHADATWYASGAGEHQIKFGVQYDRTGNRVLSGELRPRVTIRWDGELPATETLPGGRGPYGYYSVRSNAVDPTHGFITQGDIHMNNIGFFVQDAWTLNNKLTVNVGVRTEQEKVPTYTTGADIPEFGVDFGFKDKLAPRVGAAYDVRGDGKWKIFGSWGMFYDFFKLELPRGSFGGDKWIEYYYTLDTFDWPNLLADSACPPACPGTYMRQTDFRHPSFGSDAIDPDLKPMKLQEATLGIDHELNSQLAVGVHYVHKQIDKAIEDTGSLDAAGNEIYVIANPGEGLTALAFTDPAVNLPKPKRDYDSVEFFLDKRFAANWSFRTSYLWSRLYGNYSGLSQSDEQGRTSPNVGRLFDYPAMMFDQHGQPVFGALATDRPHQFKAQFIYQFNFGTAVGLNEYVASGTPVSREIGILPTSNFPVNYLGRLSDGRTDTFSQTDLFAQHELKLGGGRRLQFQMNVLNLFNQEAATSKYSTYQKIDGVTFDEHDFYTGRLDFAQLISQQGVEQDPRFLKNNFFQAPIIARFGVKFLF